MLKQLNQTRDLINEKIEDYLPKEGLLSEVVRYATSPPGKCLRGYLAINAGKVFGSNQEELLNLGAAIELIHSYSLVHDDLPALDNDDVRREKASCHKAFGEANAILAGNFILMLAFKIIGITFPVATSTATDFVNEIIEGQAQDLTNDKELQHIFRIHRMKTGALFALAASLGASFAGCKVLSSIEEYGYKIGLAFQILDDISDNCGVMKTMNKDQAQLLGKQTISEAKDILGQEDINKTFFFEFADYIVESCTE